MIPKDVQKFVISLSRGVLVVILEILVPVFYVLHLPLFFNNFLMRWIGPKLNPKLTKIMTGMSAMGASDHIYTKPLYTVLLNYFVDGEIDIEEHRKMFLDNILNVRDSEGKLRYPELRQYIDKAYGYSFWANDEEFRIENHVKLCDKYEYFNLESGQDLNELTLMKSTNDILSKPFHEKRSPWEALVFHGAKPENSTSDKQSLVIFRYHHAMSDGYSVTKLMSNVITGEYYKTPQESVPLWKSILSLAIYPYVALIAYFYIIPKYIDNNPWSFIVDPKKRHDQGNVDKLRDVVYVCSDPIPLSKIKGVKRREGVSFNEVLIQGIAGGVRKYFVKHGIPMKPMHAGLSFPVPGHPNKLTNHWTAVFPLLPLETGSAKKRLKDLRSQFKNWETKIFSQIAHVGSIYSGLLPNCLLVHVMAMVLEPSTITLSIFPGPDNLKLLTGENIVAGGFVLGPMEGQGVCITIVSCNGGLRVFFGIERSLLVEGTEEDAKEIVRNITNEFFVK